jgi:hypothetical protein
MRRLSALLAIGAWLLAIHAPTPAHGITLSLQPASSTISVGGVGTVDVVISGLGNGVTPSLGGYILEISYDPALVLPTAVTFGPHLDAGIAGSSSAWMIVSPGTLGIDEVSFEDSAALNASQPPSFTLATLTFQGLAAGVSAIGFLSVDLTSEDPCCGLDADIANASLTVAASTTVPEAGATWLLLGLALVGLHGFGASRRRLHG